MANGRGSGCYLPPCPVRGRRRGWRLRFVSRPTLHGPLLDDDPLHHGGAVRHGDPLHDHGAPVLELGRECGFDPNGQHPSGQAHGRRPTRQLRPDDLAPLADQRRFAKAALPKQRSHRLLGGARQRPAAPSRRFLAPVPLPPRCPRSRPFRRHRAAGSRTDGTGTRPRARTDLRARTPNPGYAGRSRTGS